MYVSCIFPLVVFILTWERFLIVNGEGKRIGRVMQGGCIIVGTRREAGGGAGKGLCVGGEGGGETETRDRDLDGGLEGWERELRGKEGSE